MNEDIAFSSRPMRRARFSVRCDARKMPLATSAPKGLIEMGIGGKPLNKWAGSKGSSGSVMYGMSGSLSMVGAELSSGARLRQEPLEQSGAVPKKMIVQRRVRSSRLPAFLLIP